MQNRLFKWFFKWLGIMLLLLILYAVFGPSTKKISLEEVSFKTTQSSELYFKNIRSYFYNKEEHKESGFHLYSLKSLEENGSPLSFVILQNWMMSEAYIMLETGSTDELTTPFTIEIEEEQQLVLNAEDSYAQYVFAAQVFTALENDMDLRLKQKDVVIYISERDKKALHKSLGDYFRLVGKIR